MKIDKVLAYIYRQQNDKLELLVFRHRDYPDAGIQVPAGSVEPDESVNNAIIREVEEETGLLNPQIKQVLGTSRYKGKKRKYFQVNFPDTLPNCWTHVVSSVGKDRGLVFEYFWLDTHQAKSELAGDQGEFLD